MDNKEEKIVGVISGNKDKEVVGDKKEERNINEAEILIIAHDTDNENVKYKEEEEMDKNELNLKKKLITNYLLIFRVYDVYDINDDDDIDEYLDFLVVASDAAANLYDDRNDDIKYFKQIIDNKQINLRRVYLTKIIYLKSNDILKGIQCIVMMLKLWKRFNSQQI